MRISEHFTLAELTTTATGLANVPDPLHLSRLSFLCADLLEPIRGILRVPLRVNSGYRSAEVNRAVRGSATSAHCTGDAADIVPVGIPSEVAMREIARAHAAGKLPRLDQCILYASGMIHIGQPRASQRPRGDLLRSAAPSGAGGPYSAYILR